MVKRAILAALAAAACDAGFEEEAIVKDLRILGVQAEPPEVILDVDLEDPDSLEDVEIPPVTITALVADPGVPRRLRWNLGVCPPNTQDRCDDPTMPFQQIGQGIIEDPDETFELPTDSFVVLPSILQESVRADDLAGFGGVAVQIELVVYPDGDDDLTEAVYAEKQMLYSPRLPPERVANANPWIDGVQVGDEDPVPIESARCGTGALPPLLVAPGEELRIEPLEQDGVRETYVLPTFDGGTRTITENLRYKWYATGGSFRGDETGGPIDVFGNDPVLWTEWTAPEDAMPRDIRFWIVQRDERGGQSWNELCVRVGP
jgi:hypothetical protein